MQQVVCTKCRCSNQFGTIFCRNCGKKLPVIDGSHPDFKLKNEAKNAFKRLLKLIFFLAVLAFIGAVVLPVGFKAPPKLNPKELQFAQAQAELIAKRIDSGAGQNVFKLSPAEAGYVGTQLLKPKPPTKKKKGDARGSRNEPAAEAAATAEAPTKEEFGTINCRITDGKITVIYSKPYYKFTQLRLEVTGEFTAADTDKKDDSKAKAATEEAVPEAVYRITGARLGHIPLPKLFFPHMRELFRSFVFNRRIERAVSLLEDAKVEDGKIIIKFKQQIK